jgi:hypothetical protein
LLALSVGVLLKFPVLTKENIRKFVNWGSFGLLLLGLVSFFVVTRTNQPRDKGKLPSALNEEQVENAVVGALSQLHHYRFIYSGGSHEIAANVHPPIAKGDLTLRRGADETVRLWALNQQALPTPQSIEQELRTLLTQGKGESPEFESNLETLAILLLLQRAESLKAPPPSPPSPPPPPLFHDYLWPVMMLFFGGIIKFSLDWVLPQKKKPEQAKPEAVKPAQGNQLNN